MSYGSYISSDNTISPVPLYSTDPDGRYVVSVLLSNRQAKVSLYQNDYDSIVAQYGLHGWTAQNNDALKDTVFVSGPVAGGKTDVARFLTGNVAGKVVRYIDGSPLNLRKGNLALDNAPAA